MAAKDDKANTTEARDPDVPVDRNVNDPDTGDEYRTARTTLSAQEGRLGNTEEALNYLTEENLTVTERIDRAKEVESEEAHRDGGPRQQVLEEINKIREKYRGQY